MHFVLAWLLYSLAGMLLSMLLYAFSLPPFAFNAPWPPGPSLNDFPVGMLVSVLSGFGFTVGTFLLIRQNVRQAPIFELGIRHLAPQAELWGVALFGLLYGVIVVASTVVVAVVYDTHRQIVAGVEIALLVLAAVWWMGVWILDWGLKHLHAERAEVAKAA